MASLPKLTRGPALWSEPLATMPIPVKPLSDEPMASVITACGTSSTNSCFTDCENSAAWLETATIDDAS